jgi:glutamyl/glutaminyl-tRNA synthetase
MIGYQLAVVVDDAAMQMTSNSRSVGAR